MQHITLSPGARLTAVKLKNQEGQPIGKVVEWLMDVREGKVVYVIVSFDDDAPYYAVPWQFMEADIEGGGYRVDQQWIVSRGVTLESTTLADTVARPDYLQEVMNGYGLSDTTQQPTATDRDAREKPDGETLPPPSSLTDASVSEGRGYGR